jgi:ABC-type amino acid transport substrate-binding protein
MIPMALFKPLACALGFIVSAQALAGREIEVLYTENPPLICATNGELDCIAGQLINAAARSGGFTIKPREVPWGRAEHMLESRANAIFASSGRNEFSESHYNWYFQVYTDDVFLWTLRDKKVTSDADIGRLGKINIRRGSPFGAYLERRGHGAKIYETGDWIQGVKMMQLGRVDGQCYTGLIGRKNIIELQKIPEAEVNRYKLGELSWYLNARAHGELSPELVEFRRLLEAEKGKAAFQAVLKKHGVRP